MHRLFACSWFLISFACGWPTCLSCLPDDEVVRPGVGVDLALDYGTVSIRYHNGSNVPIAKADGTSAYRLYMRQLLKNSSNVNGVDGRSDGPSKASASDYDSNALFGMLANLSKLAQPHLKSPITTMTLTTPIFLNAIQWRTQFLPTAADLSLRLVSALGPFMQTNAMEAAAAGSGYLMCPSYTDVPQCFDEIVNMPWEAVLAIEYSPTALSAMFSPALDSPLRENSFVDTSLGVDSNLCGGRSPELHHPLVGPELSLSLDNCGTKASEHSETYWARLRARLRQLRDTSNLDRAVERLVLMGENAADEMFLANVRDAFAGVLPPPPIHQPLQHLLGDHQAGAGWSNAAGLRGIDPVFAASMGAAEIAKRAMEAPDACVERSECVERRKRLRVDGEG